jgi:uncharacterized protein (TIGR02001 family)
VRHLAALLVGTELLVASTTAPADDAYDWGTVSGSVAALSDYVTRGGSLTRGQPAGQVSLEWTRPFIPELYLYAGGFVSNILIPDIDRSRDLRFRVELNLDAGIRYKPTDRLSLDIGFVRYLFPWSGSKLQPGSHPPDWNEAYLLADYDTGFARLYGQYYRSENFSFGSGRGTYLSAAVDVPLSWRNLVLTAHAGHQDVENHVPLGLPDYSDVSLGLSRDCPELGGINVALTVSATTVARNALLTDKRDAQQSRVDPRVYDTFRPRVGLVITKSF